MLLLMIEHMVDKRISMPDPILSSLKQINLIENPVGNGFRFLLNFASVLQAFRRNQQRIPAVSSHAAANVENGSRCIPTPHKVKVPGRMPKQGIEWIYARVQAYRMTGREWMSLGRAHQQH